MRSSHGRVVAPSHPQPALCLYKTFVADGMVTQMDARAAKERCIKTSGPSSRWLSSRALGRPIVHRTNPYHLQYCQYASHLSYGREELYFVILNNLLCLSFLQNGFLSVPCFGRLRGNDPREGMCQRSGRLWRRVGRCW